MAMNYKLQDFASIIGKDVFVDANVLIYLFWPTGQYSFEADYARVFRNLLRQGNRLFVDFLVRVCCLTHNEQIVNNLLKTFFVKVHE